MDVVTALWLAFSLDLMFGDPRWFPHPVRLMAMLASRFENFFRSFFTNERLAGSLTVIAVLLSVFCLTSLLFLFLLRFSSMFYSAGCVLLLYFSLALRDLIIHANDVIQALELDDLSLARNKVAMLVGRDTDNLDQAGVVRACVESVAENTSDGVIAPLFWSFSAGTAFAFFSGAAIAPAAATVAALLYKSVNTMDSMFGYKNEQYHHFGTVAAKLDDWLNFLPARLTALAIVMAAFIIGKNQSRAWQILRRDGSQHPSPNSGRPEAAMAGALGIRLAGPQSYFGQTVKKPFIGDALYKPNSLHIRTANRILFVGSFCLMLLLTLFYSLIF